MALRPLASGTISFGLVAIPVKLFTSTESSKTVRFNYVHKECGTRVKYRYYCPTDDKLVERDELSKGYEVAKGQYVLFTAEELKALEPDPTHAIDIHEFIPLDKVDPIYFDRAYYLGPGKGGARPYRLLSQALEQSQRAALGRYCARGKDYLVLLRPHASGGLVMQQLRYGEDVRSFSEVPIDEAEVQQAEVELALQLIEQRAAEEFDPNAYKDEVRDKVWGLLDKKIQGEEIVAPPEETPQAQIVDLMVALKASLGESEEAGRKPAKRSARTAARKKAAQS